MNRNRFGPLQHYALSLLLLFFLSCQNDLMEERRFEQQRRIERFIEANTKTHTYSDGVYHMVIEPGYGYRIQPGDTVKFWYVAYTLDSRVFDTNIYEIAREHELDTLTHHTLFMPIEYEVGSGILIEGLNRGIPLCRGGEISTIVFNSDYGFGEDKIGPIPAWSPLAYDVVIISVTNPSIRNEIKGINGYILNSSIDFELDTIRGFLYSPPSKGTNPALMDTIYGWYKGYTMDGIVFSQSDDSNQMIVLNPSKKPDDMPVGLIYAFTNYTKGDSAKVLLPSPVAFGIEGNEHVEPYESVIYSLRVDSIK